MSESVKIICDALIVIFGCIWIAGWYISKDEVDLRAASSTSLLIGILLVIVGIWGI